ncbi:endo-1,4-beta-xylanase [Microbacterium sp. DT81.1]|uniref:endo-1,4-beta-xylanase n=1 Tax=Microbacterium sp. DT81.1 TaxID=3393413 RepID=UPI003CEAD85B
MPELTHRLADAQLLLVDASGSPLERSSVTVEQTRHAFGFGNIGFDFVDWLGGPPRSGDGRASEILGGDAPPQPEALADAWLTLFNTVTLVFYWRGFEPVRGQPETTRLLRTAEWFKAHDVTVKGHPLLWHTLAPEWLLGLDDAEVEAVIRNRIRREVTAFTGAVDQWDAINEAVILPVFTAEENAVTRLAQRKGRIAMIQLAFEEARAANPGSRLVLNDFDLSEDYERLIEECLAAGIRIDALGLQTHMHQGYRGEERVWNVLERFSRFGLPLQLTETTLLSGELMPREIVDLNDYVVESWPSTPEGEVRQADEIVRHYRNVVAHPAVESLTYWGITDHGAWLGAPAGLLRRDGTRKPAYDALRALIRDEWWYPRTQLRTDAAGGVTVHGFAGSYRISTPYGTEEVELSPGRTVSTVIVGA